MTELLALYSCHLPTSPGQAPKILKIQVKVLDTREIFSGRVDVLVTPVAGEGQAWIAETSLEFEIPPNEVLGLGGEEHEYVPQTEDAYVPPEDAPIAAAIIDNGIKGRPIRDAEASQSTPPKVFRVPPDAPERYGIAGTRCPECGAPIRWDQSVRDDQGAGYGWVHVWSSRCSGTKGLAEPKDAPNT